MLIVHVDMCKFINEINYRTIRGAAIQAKVHQRHGILHWLLHCMSVVVVNSLFQQCFRLHNFFTFVLLICVIKNSISCFVATSELFNIVKHIPWACVWWFPWAYPLTENFILCVVHWWQVSDFGLTIANPNGSPPKNSV